MYKSRYIVAYGTWLLAHALAPQIGNHNGYRHTPWDLQRRSSRSDAEAEAWGRTVARYFALGALALRMSGT